MNTAGWPPAAGRFANISAVSGLDFPDDGRALAVLDWDHDGDLDLWLSNRNAPRLRLMRNDTPTKNHWVALRLAGDGMTCNRDAIGARVEVVLRKPESEKGNPKSIKTLRAGEGFLSQSSKWMSFGLGAGDQIEKVVVRWPSRGGAVQEFTGMEVDGRYRLVQGREAAEPVAPRADPPHLTPSRPEVPAATDAARIPAVTLVKPPPWEFRDTGGRQVGLGAGRPVLLMLWATWCAPCVAELTEMRDRAAEIREAGLEVVALGVDVLGGEESDPAKARGMLERLRFPFLDPSMGEGVTEDIVGELQSLHDTLVRLHRPLPVPSSFLIDADGNISVIYRGRLSVDGLLADVKHSGGSLAERWVRAAPLPGRTIEHEGVLRTRQTNEATVNYLLASQHYARGAVDSTVHYLKAALRYDPASAHAHQLLGEIYLLRGKWAEAERHYREAVRLAGEVAVHHHGLGRIYANTSRLELALPEFLRALALDPGLTDAYRQRAKVHHARGDDTLALDDCNRALESEPDHAGTFMVRGQIHKKLGNHGAALRDFDRALELKPDIVQAAYLVAWHLATCPDQEVRNGKRAVAVATRAGELTQWKHFAVLDALAAACAEDGQFEPAARWESKAIELAPEPAKAEMRARLKLYRAAKAYHESLP